MEPSWNVAKKRRKNILRPIRLLQEPSDSFGEEMCSQAEVSSHQDRTG